MKTRTHTHGAGKKNFFSPLRRQALATLTGVAVALATIPSASADLPAINTAPVETTKTLTQKCVGTEYRPFIGNANKEHQDIGGSVSPVSVRVVAPKQVEAGQQFQVVLDPADMTTNSGSDFGRIKMDFALPDNLEITKIEATGATGTYAGMSNPVAVRINAAGAPDPNGKFVRIWGGATVNNSPSAATNSPKSGWRVKESSTFSAPTLTLTAKAPANGAGRTLDFGTRSAGTAATRGGNDNFMSFAQDDLIADDDYWCGADAASAKLASVQVVRAGSEIAFSETQLDLITGATDAQFKATVSTNSADKQLLTRGDVEFYVDGQKVGSSKPDANGVATYSYTFPNLQDRDPVSYKVTAKFVGVEGRITPSSTTEDLTVNVNPIPLKDVNTPVTLKVNRLAGSGDQRPARLVATLNPDNGRQLPEGAKVEFLRDGVSLGTVDVKNNSAQFIDREPTIGAENQTLRYTVKFPGLIDEQNLDSERMGARYLASESEPVEYSINGENATNTKLEVSSEEIGFGDEVELKATLTKTGDDQVIAGQTIEFLNNGLFLGEATTGEDGVAVLRTTLTEGKNAITAHFNGAETSGVYLHESTSEEIVVTADGKSVGETSTKIDVAAQAVHGDEVKITAKVTRADGSALPTDGNLGNVAFFVNNTHVGTAPVQIVDGEAVAEWTHKFSGRGDYQLYAAYTGAEQEEEILKDSNSEVVPVKVDVEGVEIGEPTGPVDGSDGSSPGSSDGMVLSPAAIAGIIAGILAGFGVIAAIINFIIGR